MSLTLLYRSKRVQFVYSLKKRQLAAALVLVIGLVFIAGRSTQSSSEHQARIAYTQSGLIQQRQEVEALKQTTEQQLTGMLLKLGEVQGQVQRLNALGSRLVEQANLEQEEFGFNQLPAIGGPSHELADVNVDAELQVLTDIDGMLELLDDKHQQLQVLESLMMSHHIDAESYLAGRPVRSGWLSSYYGIRKDPFNGLPAMHKGLDFAGKEGDVVVATGAGIVIWSGERYGYGNLVEIDHGDGLTTRYGHNKSLSVNLGDVVTKGQVIGLMGSTGRSTGAHVHYEVLRNGVQQDPLSFVSRKGRTAS